MKAAPIDQSSIREKAATLTYVVLTAARNEEELIEKTLKSMVIQTVKPLKWIIVSDGSTDRTDEIVRSYAEQHPWIELMRMPERKERDFGGKARSINTAYEHVRNLQFDLVSNLDADISFGPTLFEYLLGKFRTIPRLGVGGTPYAENPEKPHLHSCSESWADLNYVSGACQLFRRECWEQIGGYVQIKSGGMDWIAVTTARINGWQTTCFVDQHYFHHRKVGTGTWSPLGARFEYGKKAYWLGGHPLWEVLRGIASMKQSPFVIGGLSFIWGYFYAAMTRTERKVPIEVMQFRRADQMARLRKIVGLGK